jgi:hypothetical protein
VVHGGQAVVDGGGPVLVQGLASRLRLQVAVAQGLHHGVRHLLLDLHPAHTQLSLCFDFRDSRLSGELYLYTYFKHIHYGLLKASAFADAFIQQK